MGLVFGSSVHAGNDGSECGPIELSTEQHQLNASGMGTTKLCNSIVVVAGHRIPLFINESEQNMYYLHYRKLFNFQ
jgi:hypothetical protein